MWKSILKNIAPRLIVSAILFLLFFNPIITVGQLLSYSGSRFIVETLFGPYPYSGTDASASARWNSISEIIYGTVSVFIIFFIISALLFSGFWLYSLGVNLAYSLGYRSQILALHGTLETAPLMDLNVPSPNHDETKTPVDK